MRNGKEDVQEILSRIPDKDEPLDLVFCCFFSMSMVQICSNCEILSASLGPGMNLVISNVIFDMSEMYQLYSRLGSGFCRGLVGIFVRIQSPPVQLCGIAEVTSFYVKPRNLLDPFGRYLKSITIITNHSINEFYQF